MSIRIVPTSLALSALIISGLAGCSAAQPPSPPATADADRVAGGSAGSGDVQARATESDAALEPAAPEASPAADIRTLDLANTACR